MNVGTSRLQKSMARTIMKHRLDVGMFINETSCFLLCIGSWYIVPVNQNGIIDINRQINSTLNNNVVDGFYIKYTSNGNVNLHCCQPLCGRLLLLLPHKAAAQHFMLQKEFYSIIINERVFRVALTCIVQTG